VLIANSLWLVDTGADRMTENINIGLLGYGTVGSNLFRLLEEQAEEIVQATGMNIAISKILVRDPTLPRSGAPEGIFTGDYHEIVNDDSISIVVELIGSVEPAFDYITEALEKGKAVVTANKQLISKQGSYLFKLSQDKKTQIKFEASVAGAIPVIRVLRESMAVTNIQSIYGIVNGTTNFILTEMSRTGAKYEDALANAQEWGYAEADPTEDVSGADAAAKMAILASIAFHSTVKLDNVDCAGIQDINPLDIEYARDLGFTIKLLGVAKLYHDQVNVRVYPALLSHDHPLASVSGAYNAVFLQGSAIDEIMLSGPGAGGMETASAVVSDIVSIVSRKTPGFLEYPVAYKELDFFADDEVVSTFYLRLEVDDKPGVLASIASIFGDHDVSIEQVLQKGRGVHAELVMVFHPVKEKGFNEALAKIADMPEVKAEPRPLRVEGNHDQ
jgi:homoserine dehydrogenase